MQHAIDAIDDFGGSSEHLRRCQKLETIIEAYDGKYGTDEADCQIERSQGVLKVQFGRAKKRSPKLDARDSYLVAAGFVFPGTNTP